MNEAKTERESIPQALPVQAHKGKKIPLTSDRCIIFPFDKAKLRYLRDTYKKILIKDVCSPDKITQVITDIESACDNFNEHLFYRKIIRLSLALGSLGFFIGLVLIIAGIIVTPTNSAQLSHASGLHINTVVGMIVISFSVILIYLVIIKVGHDTKNLNMLYIARYDKVLASYRKEFANMQMRWRIGSDRMWLELWLDFKKGQSEINEDPEIDMISEAPRERVDSKNSLKDKGSEGHSEEEIDEYEWQRTQKRKGYRHQQQKESRDLRPKGLSKFDIASSRSFLKVSLKPRNKDE